jgi:hypothetical protein
MTGPPQYAADPLAQLRAEAQKRMFAQFDPTVLSRLVLIPAWTDALADAVGLWTKRTGRDALNTLEQADIVERRLVSAPGGTSQAEFWVRERSRSALAGFLHNVTRLERDLDQLVSAVAGLDTSAFGITAWFEVASTYRQDSSGVSLIQAVDNLVAAGRLAVATDLVGAARVLGEVTGGPLADAGRRAGWHIERAYRADVDNEALRFYVNRAEPESALDELIGASPSWALHFLGGGGVGKTMLIRYLASGRYAADRGRPMFPVARADFDYLDPRYPQERPAELLLALAHELVSFGDTRAVYQFYRRFQDAANHLHEESARADPDEGLLRELQERAVGQFARVVAEAADPGQPVVLILDTCEELAKLYPPGSRAPAIDRTFGLLEQLREQAPAVRVLLAGRRWLTPAADDATRAAGPKLLDRPYLRVLPLAGLPADEAASYVGLRAFLAARRRPRRPRRPDPDLRDAILDRAREPDDSGRYNPFELASYCEWAYSDTPPDAAELRAAPGDPYVELRIIGRIMDDAVRQALPVAVEFGRFDVELIRPALTRTGVDADKAFAGLAAQEWTRALTITADGLPGVIEVDEHLRDRIRKALVKTSAYAVGDPARLGRDAAALLPSGPLRDVPAEVVEAAVRLLPVGEAAAMWEKLEEKIVAESAWPWAETVTARAGAVELTREGPENIMAAILATQAAARIHAGITEGLAKLWGQVVANISDYPTSGDTWLYLRAVFGRAAVGPTILGPAVSVIFGKGIPLQADLGSLVAALDGLIGRGERIPAEVLRTAQAAVVADETNDVSRAGLALALATAALKESRLDEAAELADAALAAATRAAELSGPGPGRDCADWRPPPGLVDRCRLAVLLIACQRGDPYDEDRVRDWRRGVLDRPRDADAQRLAAFAVQYELGHHPLAAEILTSLDIEAPSARALTWLHRQAGSLAAALAQGWLALGDPDRAAQVLRTARDRVVELVGDDPETIEELQLALLSLCRRCRSQEYASVLQLCYSGTPAVRAEAWLVRTLLTGDRPPNPAEAGSWHGWWRCQDALTAAWALSAPPDSEPGISAGDSAADRLEFEALRERFPVPIAPEAPVFNETAARQWLLTNRQPPTQLPAGIVGRAVLAAAEVLALRLPDVAAPRLSECVSLLEEAFDFAGASQALVLAGLARARAGHSVDGAEPSPSLRREIDVMSEAPQWRGWRDYITTWRVVTGELPGPPVDSLSPELDLGPATSEPTASRRWLPRFTAAQLTFAVFFAALLVAVPLAGAGASAEIGIAAGLPSALLFIGLLRDLFGYSTDIPRSITIRPAGEGRATLTGGRYGGLLELTKGHNWEARLNRSLTGRCKWSADVPVDSLEPVGVRKLFHPSNWIFGAYLAVVVNVDPRLEAYPWEQRIGSTFPRWKTRRAVFVRAVPGYPPSATRKKWLSASAVYMGPRALAPPKPVTPRLQSDGTVKGRPYRRVIYLVGTPVSTSAGWRMRVSPGASAETVESARGTVSGEELVSVDGLGLGGTWLVVLQAEPLDGPPRPLGDLAPGFRALAREAVEAGAAVAIVIPTLPDQAAAEIVATIWSRFARRTGLPPGRQFVLAGKAKTLCYVPAAPGSEQPALDVLVYARAAPRRKGS